MASALSKQRDYKYIAETYSKVNAFQVELGKQLINLLGVKRGDKVLDMGCGTGEITSFIADQVGEEGEVIGVDPDQDRIKVATQKHCGARRNIKFMVGDSSSHFPHYNDGYYDIHFSNFVLHWLTDQEKDVFFRTALNCLKPGGTIATLNAACVLEVMNKVPELLPDEHIERNRPPAHYVEKSVATSTLEKAGFVILSGEYIEAEYTFPSLENFLTWYCASDYVDEKDILPCKKKSFAKKFVNDDGTVYVKSQIYRIIAKK